MLQPNDINKVTDEEWETFKEQAYKDELYYNGPGDLLDTEEGRQKFCKFNKDGIFNKPDPKNPGYKIWVFNLQGKGITIKRRSDVDPDVMIDTEYDASGKEIGKSYEPA